MGGGRGREGGVKGQIYPCSLHISNLLLNRICLNPRYDMRDWGRRQIYPLIPLTWLTWASHHSTTEYVRGVGEGGDRYNPAHP